MILGENRRRDAREAGIFLEHTQNIIPKSLRFFILTVEADDSLGVDEVPDRDGSDLVEFRSPVQSGEGTNPMEIGQTVEYGISEREIVIDFDELEGLSLKILPNEGKILRRCFRSRTPTSADLEQKPPTGEFRNPVGLPVACREAEIRGFLADCSLELG